MLGSKRDGDMVPKTVYLGYQLYLSGNVPDQLQIMIDTLFFLREPIPKGSVQIIEISRQVNSFFSNKTVLISLGIHSKKNQIIGHAQSLI
jgi:hypothetical protein